MSVRSLSLLVSIAIAWCAASASGQVFIEDTEFPERDWELIAFVEGVVHEFHVLATQGADGGHPGAHRRVSIDFHGPGAGWAVSLMHEPIDLMRLGGITRIDWAIDRIIAGSDPPGGELNLSLIIEQNGAYFRRSLALFSSTAWNESITNSRVAEDFVQLPQDAPPAQLDLSSNGSPVRLGFAYAISNGQREIVGAVDNFRVTVHPPDPCGDQDLLAWADTEFSLDDWGIVKVHVNAGGDAEVSQVADGGHPGQFRFVDMSVSGQSHLVAHFLDCALVSPSDLGGIEQFEFAIDHTRRPPQSECCVGVGVVVEQAGQISNTSSLVFPGPDWSTTVATVVASDLTPPPDFSAQAPPLRLGFFTAMSGGTAQRTIGIDNFSIRVIPGCPGDVDHDGTVGFGDLVSTLSTWGPCVGCAADVDGDDVVGFADVVALLAAWGACK